MSSYQAMWLFVGDIVIIHLYWYRNTNWN